MCEECNEFNVNVKGHCMCHLVYNTVMIESNKSMLIDLVNVDIPELFYDSLVPCSLFFDAHIDVERI
jgi:hypothetical protein